MERFKLRLDMAVVLTYISACLVSILVVIVVSFASLSWALVHLTSSK